MKTIFLTTLLLAFSIMTSAQIKPKVATSEISTADTSILDLNSDDDGIGNVAMNKGELIDAIAKDAGLSKADASRALNAFVAIVTASLKNGESVQLNGFGTFYVEQEPSQTIKDTKAGRTKKIATKKVAKFKAGKALADTVK